MPERFEILTSARFFVGIQLDGSQDPIDGYFMECQGFKRTQAVIEVCEVTAQAWGRDAQAKKGRVVRTKLPGNVKSENIVLRRGLTVSMTLWNWFSAVEGGKWGGQSRPSNGSSASASGQGVGQRYDGRLVIYDQAGEERARLAFEGAWPVSYKLADLSASKNEFEIEEVELAVDAIARIK